MHSKNDMLYLVLVSELIHKHNRLSIKRLTRCKDRRGHPEVKCQISCFIGRYVIHAIHVLVGCAGNHDHARNTFPSKKSVSKFHLWYADGYGSDVRYKCAPHDLHRWIVSYPSHTPPTVTLWFNSKMKRFDGW